MRLFNQALSVAIQSVDFQIYSSYFEPPSKTLKTISIHILLEDTISKHGAPEIHNSDQGSQYTSTQYIEVLKSHNIQISMDGKGRALDNIYIERFWKSIKYEKIYLNPPNGGLDLYEMVNEYIEFYNTKRRHTEIGKLPPIQVYHMKKKAS